MLKKSTLLNTHPQGEQEEDEAFFQDIVKDVAFYKLSSQQIHQIWVRGLTELLANGVIPVPSEPLVVDTTPKFCKHKILARGCAICFNEELARAKGTALPSETRAVDVVQRAVGSGYLRRNMRKS